MLKRDEFHYDETFSTVVRFGVFRIDQVLLCGNCLSVQASDMLMPVAEGYTVIVNVIRKDAEIDRKLESLIGSTEREQLIDRCGKMKDVFLFIDERYGEEISLVLFQRRWSFCAVYSSCTGKRVSLSSKKVTATVTVELGSAMAVRQYKYRKRSISYVDSENSLFQRNGEH